jgi:hypothetical protein
MGMRNAGMRMVVISAFFGFMCMEQVFASATDSMWVKTGANNIYNRYQSNGVLIGTTNAPGTNSKFQVNGGVAIGYNSSTATALNGLTVSGPVSLGTTNVPGSGTVLLANGGAVIGSNTAGTTAPANGIQVYGNGIFQGRLDIIGQVLMSGTTPSLETRGAIYTNTTVYAAPAAGTYGGNGDKIIFWPGVTPNVYPYSLGINSNTLWYSVPSGATHKWYIGGASTMQIASNGTVCIGTTTPGTSYKLVVEGKIGAREVVVTRATWADHVFNDDYNLKPLNKVAEYVKTHKHLEGIPTAAEVKKNGVPVGEMQAKLLQKVEELTLYTIAMKKENDELRTKVEELEKRMGR